MRLEQFDKTAARADFARAKELGYDSSIVDEWIKKVDGKSELVGIDIEIAKEIAHAMKKNLKVVNTII